jgi:pyrroloquinoline quinone biosynthesis protein E
MLPLEFPNVRHASVRTVWQDSSGFNHFRGDAWMKEPCRSCPEKGRDFGGCRCQAYLLTGDAANADPVCDLSPHHHLVIQAVARAEALVPVPPVEKPLLFRSPANSTRLSRITEPGSL